METKDVDYFQLLFVSLERFYAYFKQIRRKKVIGRQVF